MRIFSPPLLLASLLMVTACGGGSSGGEQTSQKISLPEGFPAPQIPEDNPFTEEKAELGRHLFYDRRLSLNGTMSCASCHQQGRAFTDGQKVAVGSTGESHPRNTQGLANVGYAVTLNWANPLTTRLEDQLLVPLFAQHPVELGFGGRDEELLSRIESEPLYVTMFERAFKGDPAPISLANIAKAVSTFERKIISGNSPYDQYVYQGNQSALSEAAKRGLFLFFSERLECDHCHGGLNFSSATNHEGQTFVTNALFENNGIYNINGTGDYPPENPGLIEFSGKPSDMGKFKPPSLRNVGVTAPYMHDGSMATLEEVIDHYAAGGRTIEDGPYRGDGSLNPFKSGLVSGFSLSPGERQDLVAFLESLTDQDLLIRADLANPFPE